MPTASERGIDLSKSFEDWPCAAFIERDGMVVGRNRLARQMAGGVARESALPVSTLLPGAEFALRGQERVRFDCMLIRRYGSALMVHVAAQPAVVDGRPCRLVLLMESEQTQFGGDSAGLRVEDVLDALPEAAAITNGSTVVHVNREFTRLFGWPQMECIGRDMTELVVPEGRHHEREMMLHMVRTTGRCDMETVRRTREGEQLDVSVRGVAVRLGGDAFGVLATYRDIRAEKQKEAHLAFRAKHDILTGLPNRAQFLEKVEMMLERLRRRPDRSFAVIFLDLDGFKKVNDTLGHAAGDDLLVDVAERLTQCLRPQDAVARFGGDEFALLLDESGGAQKVEGVLLRIQNEVQRPVKLEPFGTAHVAASMGVVIVGAEHESAEAILAEADHAMYEAKAAGKARYVLR